MDHKARILANITALGAKTWVPAEHKGYKNLVQIGYQGLLTVGDAVVIDGDFLAIRWSIGRPVWGIVVEIKAPDQVVVQVMPRKGI